MSLLPLNHLNGAIVAIRESNITATQLPHITIYIHKQRPNIPSIQRTHIPTHTPSEQLLHILPIPNHTKSIRSVHAIYWDLVQW